MKNMKNETTKFKRMIALLFFININVIILGIMALVEDIYRESYMEFFFSLGVVSAFIIVTLMIYERYF